MDRSLRGALRWVGVVALLFTSSNNAAAGGAIAIGPCAAYGYAYDYSDLKRARATALRRCSDGGCRVAVTMRGACAAFAVDGRNACGAYGYAVDVQLGQAQNKALEECYTHGGRECVIRAFACDAKG